MRYSLNRTQVVQEAFDDETILINLKTGAYYSLNKVGARILSILNEGRSVDEIVLRLHQQYDAEADAAPGQDVILDQVVKSRSLQGSRRGNSDRCPIRNRTGRVG
jgi:Coenzyme PQQ synthesis protein D (PqqD)